MAAPLIVDVCFAFDHEDMKLRRAACRSRTCYRKHLAYERSREAKSSTPRSMSCQPQRALRAATRTCLARGMVEADKDMPTLVGGARAAKSVWNARKPSVAPLLKPQSSPEASPQISPQVPSEMSPLMLPEPDWKVVMDSLASLSDQDTSDELRAGACGDVAGHVSSALESSDSEGIAEETPAPKGRELENPEIADASTQSSPEDGEKVMHTTPPQEVEQFAKREAILRQLVATLHSQAAEANRAAADAMQQAQDAQQKAAEAEKAMQLDRKAALKKAMEEEKQRATALRRKRSQERHVRATKEKAERVMAEAQEIRERAVDEAVMIRAQLLAEADKAAATKEQAVAEAEATKAQAIALAQEIRKQAERALAEATAKAQAEALELKRRAEKEAEAVKVQAAFQLRAMQVELQALKSKASTVNEARTGSKASDGVENPFEEALVAEPLKLEQQDGPVEGWELLAAAQSRVEDEEGWDLVQSVSNGSNTGSSAAPVPGQRGGR